MFKSKKVTVSLSPMIHKPEEYSISPRLLAPGISIWLKDEELEIAQGVFVAPSNKGYSIYSHNAKHNVRVNGQPLMIRRLLKDGDYIDGHKMRVIFQQDPLADYVENMKLIEDEQLIESVELSEQASDAIIIDREGLSLDGGEHRVAWNDLCYLFIYWEHTNNAWSLNAVSQSLGAIPSKFERSVLAGEDMAAIWVWMVYMCPYVMSVQSMSFSYFPDAYDVTVWDKVLLPIRSGKRQLSIPPSQILGLDSRIKIIRNMLFFMMAYLVFAFLLALVVWSVIHTPALPTFMVVYLVLILTQWRKFAENIRYFRDLPNYQSIEKFRSFSLNL